MTYRVESLLSARLFVVPQYTDGKVLSNLFDSKQTLLYGIPSNS